MATKYWINGTGTWDNTSTSNWSLGQGGIGGSIQFNGTNQYINIITSAIKLPTNSTNFTLDCWVYLTGQLNGTGIISSNLQLGLNSVPFALYGASSQGGTSGSNLCFSFFNGATWSGITSSTTLSLNTWYHIAASYDGTTATLYLDGTNIGTYTGAWDGNGNPGNIFYIGRRWDTNGSNSYFNGYITNARLMIDNYPIYSANFTRPSQPFSTYDTWSGALYFLFRAVSNTKTTNDSSSSGWTVAESSGPIAWSLSSPFTDSNTPPTSTDDVVIDSFSSATAYTITIGANASCATLRLYGPGSGNVSLIDNGNVLNIYASCLIGGTGITSSQTGGFYMRNSDQNGYGYVLNTSNNSAFSNVPLRINVNGKNPATSIYLGSDITMGNVTIDDGYVYAERGWTLTCKNLTINSGSTPAPELVTKAQGTAYSAGGLYYKAGVGLILTSSSVLSMSMYSGFLNALGPTTPVTTVSSAGTNTLSLTSGFSYSQTYNGMVATVSQASLPVGFPTAPSYSGNIYGSGFSTGAIIYTVIGGSSGYFTFDLSKFTNTTLRDAFTSAPAGTSFSLSIDQGGYGPYTFVSTGTYQPSGSYIVGSSNIPSNVTNPNVIAIQFYGTGGTIDITSISATLTLSIYGGVSFGLGTPVAASGNYTVATQNDQRSLTFWTPTANPWSTVYTSQLDGITIRKSTVGYAATQPGWVDIVFAFKSGFSYGWDFFTYVNNNGGASSIKIVGTAQNQLGTRLFNANNAGTWIDFVLNPGAFNQILQDNMNPSSYYITVQWQGFDYLGQKSFTNSAASTFSMTASLGSSTNISLTGASSSFTGGTSSSGTPYTYPRVTFKSTDTSSYNPLLFNWNYVGSITTDSTITELVVEGSSTDGYKNLSIRGTVKLNKLTVNTTANQLRRVLIRGWYFGANTVDNTYAQGSISFIGTNPTVNISDVDFTDMIITGDNISSLTVVRAGNGGGNTIGNNFAFTTPRTLYWSGASGGTVEKNTTNWSTTDGGAPTAGLMPIIHDTMKFTDNTLNSGATITIGNSGWLLPNIDFSSRTAPVTLATGAGDVNVFGNLTLSSTVTVTNGGSGTMYISGSTVNTNNVSIAKAVTIVTPRTVTFTSNFTSNPSYAASATPGMAIYCGTIDIRGITLTTTNFLSGNILASGPSGPGRAIYTNSSSAINLTRGAFNLICWQFTDGTFKTPGTTPKVNITGTTNSATVSHYYSTSNPTNTFTFDPVDVEFVGTTSSPTVQGWFGTLKLTGTASHTNTMSNSPYMYVRDNFTVLYNATSVGFALYTMPRDGTTCTIVGNWVYGSGATGATGANLSWTYFGHTFSQSTGITKVTGPITFGGGRMELRNGTLDLSNLGSNTKVNSFVGTSNSFTKTFDLRGSQLTGVGNEIAWGAGTNTTVLYDSSSKITYANSSMSCSWTTLAAAKLPPVELTSAVTSLTFWSGANFDSFTAAPGITISIMSGNTLFADKFVLNGTSFKPIYIKSYTTNSKAYIGKGGGAAVVTGVNFTDIGTSGNAEFLAYESPSATRTTGWIVKPNKRPPSGFLSFC